MKEGKTVFEQVHPLGESEERVAWSPGCNYFAGMGGGDLETNF